MKISIITLFPGMFEAVLNSSILGRAQKKNLVTFELINLRPFGIGLHKVVDDKPYGGGVGLVLKADVLAKALKSILDKKTDTKDHRIKSEKTKRPLVILTSASGETYTQAKARKLLSYNHLIIICGHYEGVDQRFIDKYVDLELSIGDYILTGGEIPAMVIADSVTRLIKGVLEKEEATLLESFEQGLLEHPHFTRPESFEGEKVPSVLASGNHQEVDRWRKEQAIKNTKAKRPDLAKD